MLFLNKEKISRLTTYLIRERQELTDSGKNWLGNLRSVQAFVASDDHPVVRITNILTIPIVPLFTPPSIVNLGCDRACNVDGIGNVAKAKYILERVRPEQVDID